jgi:hypothetical protein
MRTASRAAACGRRLFEIEPHRFHAARFRVTWLTQDLHADGIARRRDDVASVGSYAKGKDALYTTRQADFVRHEEKARAALRVISAKKASE